MTILETLRTRAAAEPDRLAYTFVQAQSQKATLTYGQLAKSVRPLAGVLLDDMGGYRRAILGHPPGLEFIAALFGCNGRVAESCSDLFDGFPAIASVTIRFVQNPVMWLEKPQDN